VRRVRRAVVERWGSPAYSWQELVCAIDSRDAGWIVQGYEQSCRIVSVDLVSPAAGDERVVHEPVGPIRTVGRCRPRARARDRADREEPYQARCPDGLLVARQYGATRLLSGRRPADLDESPAWLVVTTSVDVSTTDLGCDPSALVFCQSPVDGPVLG